MTTVTAHSARSPNVLARVWEWLGWRSKHVAAHRREMREMRAAAEIKLRDVQRRAVRSSGVAEWLRERSQQNHIAEALSEALDHPRRTAL